MTDLKDQIAIAVAAIRKVADDLEHALGDSVDEVILNVPWLSQIGPGAEYAPGDCGPACVAMILRHAGVDVSVDQVSRATSRPAGFSFTTMSELAKTATALSVRMGYWRNVTLDRIEAEIRTGHPVLALVSYPHLQKKRSQDYKYGHYVLVVGVSSNHIIYHDPYWESDSDGAYIRCGRGLWETAFATPAPGNQYGRQACLVNANGV